MLWKSIKNIKIKNKMLSVLVFALTAVFLLTLASSFIPYHTYNEQLYASGVQTLSLFAGALEDKLDEYTDFTFRVLSDHVVQSNLSVMSSSIVGSEAWLHAADVIDHQFSSFANTLDHVVTLRLTTIQGHSCYTYWGRSAIPAAQLPVLTTAARAASGSAVWHTMPAPVSRLVLVRDIREVKGLTFASLGTICLEIDLAKLVSDNLIVMQELGIPLSVAIFDGEQCLYAADETAGNIHLVEDGYQMLDTDQGRMLCMRYTSAQGWTFLMVRPFDSIIKMIHASTLQSRLLSLLAAVAALTVGGLLINMILKHLLVFLSKIDRFSQGKLPEPQEIEPYRNRRDELGRLHRHFDRMITEYDHIVRDNYEKQLAIKDAQARHLRAQIRPHFLYNTLQTIYLMAREAHQERIAGMTDALGKMMHASINERKDVITVREDWQIAREYLRIQQLRYQDHLDVQYHLDKTLETIRIPSMTIQPLVENAVHYADEEMLDLCCIRIWGREYADSVDICVEDNGPGMDEDILEKLDSGQIQPDGLGIGLTNIHRRIQLEFSQDYGLRICCRDGKTQVFIHLPKIREETDHDEAAVG